MRITFDLFQCARVCFASRHQIDTRSTLASLFAMEDSADFRTRFWWKTLRPTHYL